MSKEFSPVSYRELVVSLLNHGCESRGYKDAEPEKPHLVLRHDIDMSLQAALVIAEIEADLGVKAHYFILVRTEMYNLFSAHAQRALRGIIGFGHEIGLHLDASYYEGDTQSLDAAAEKECAVIEAATDQRVEMVSFHRPAKSLLGYAKKLGGRIHAYQPRFFSEMGYCSDSRGDWHHGHPLEHDAVREGRALQLLTHPIWWTGSMALGPVGRLDDFAEERGNLLRDELAANCEPYLNKRGLRSHE